MVRSSNRENVPRKVRGRSGQWIVSNRARGFTVRKPNFLGIYTRLKEKSSTSFDGNITILLYLQSASMKFSELQRRLERDGWYIKRTGGHYIYVHPEKKGEIVVGKHGSKEVPTGTAMKILKQAGLK